MSSHKRGNSSGLEGEQAQCFRASDGLSATVNIQFAVNMLGMRSHCIFRQNELTRNLLVRATLGQMTQHS